MPPIKILYLVGSLYYGGSQTQLVQQATNLDGERFQPFVGVLRVGGQYERSLHESGIPLVHFRRVIKYDPTVVLRIARFLREQQIDIIHTWLFGAGVVGRLAAILARTPIAVHREGLLPLIYKESCYYLGRSRRNRIINRVLRSRTDALIVQSETQARYSETVEKYDKSKVKVFPNGLDITRLRTSGDTRQRLRQELGASEGQTIIGMVANTVPQKNHLLFLQVAEQIVASGVNVLFVWIGDDVTSNKEFRTYREGLFRRLEDSPARSHIRYLGYRSDVPELLTAFDLFVLTSDYEGMPNVLLEALGTGLPVVSTDSCDFANYLGEHEGGVIVPRGNVDAMHTALMALIGNPERARLIASRGRQIATETFSAARMNAATQELYVSLLDPR